ncbi:RagB/SusD family nutrient uptake outer membrane protein [Dyadobacter psychrotolerans]|uniref:RagB/SusD family nutrient uptake outer membrane protein n=1 Tax=Dyadobacter psychrotolerans TaxID=2541721 RepID=A0A4V2Z3E5_9BACT|nr:RagB/SusD family nutrient uptake outer membrane protein [Dyadobacter psychrotolerans]TDE12128.1 RagB/SusD family nutrient uptake outer membrane protein [Dyadobacter psychrotolerans]
MRLLLKYSLVSLAAIFLVSCSLLEPVDDNHSTIDRIYADPAYAEGVLMTAYTKIPTNSLSFNDVATDDAVSNDKLSNYSRMATGQWSAMFNPVDQWSNCISGIQTLNQFTTLIDTVNWKGSVPELNWLYTQRFKGEAFALRALLQYHLLVTVAGPGANGQMLGIPIIDQFLNVNADFNIPRATFEESVNRIYSDIDQSLKYLTMNDYLNVTNASQLPAGYEKVATTNYNIVFGSELNQRISARVVKGLRAKLALLAASPAYSTDATKWVQAANYAGEVLKTIGGVTGLDPNGNKFYLKTLVDVLNVSAATPIDQKEILWRRAVVASNTREMAHYPPSLFGKGNLNPTQNLVDAFPALNGYPISRTESNFDKANPYANRDPRLRQYITYNGNTFAGKTIITGVGGGVDAKDSVESSTRTGYYLKKLLVEEVNLNPVSTTTQKHYETHMRYTELFLIYAEAANEAWGPTGTGTFGFSAKDVIAAIRTRAGIAKTDPYLTSISTKEDMRTLIRNERRLELCFEGFRFWDLRRWKSNLTEPAKGININKTTYNVVDVEPRAYSNDFMYYGPVPQTEVVKYSALIQNKGW